MIIDVIMNECIASHLWIFGVERVQHEQVWCERCRERYRSNLLTHTNATNRSHTSGM
jgi:hypothetical protein